MNRRILTEDGIPIEAVGESSREPVRVKILDDYQNVATDSIRRYGVADDVELESATTALRGADLAKFLHDAAIIVAMRERTALSAQLLESLPRLGLVITTGMANSVVEVPTHVGFSGTRILPQPVVELTWALILGLSRHIPAETLNAREGKWQQEIGHLLHGKRLGVVGPGKSGTEVARIAHAFGVSVCAWSPRLTKERATAVGVGYVSREELFSTSDVVTIHMKLHPTTVGLVNAADIERMKEDSLFINTARAQLVDYAALEKALRERKIRGAGLDVFSNEPVTDPTGSLIELPNVLATPHIGFVVKENYDIFFEDIAESIRAYGQGKTARDIER